MKQHNKKDEPAKKEKEEKPGQKPVKTPVKKIDAPGPPSKEPNPAGNPDNKPEEQISGKKRSGKGPDESFWVL